MHQALDAKPNAAYLVDVDGRIAQRVLWSNDEAGLRRAIHALLAHGEHDQYESMMIPMLRGMGCMYPVLESAGPKALDDLKREVPPVFLLARTASLFEPLPPLGRSLAAVATLVASAALVAAVTQRALSRTSRG